MSNYYCSKCWRKPCECRPQRSFAELADMFIGPLSKAEKSFLENRDARSTAERAPQRSKER